jgi:hypothetical protein
MRRKVFFDERQMSLFSEEMERFAEATRGLMDEQKPKPMPDGITEDALYMQIAAACKQAIEESGLSRAQVLDAVNAYLKRPGNGDSESKRPITINMFNHFLSKPTEYPMRTSVMQAICKVTGSTRPYELLVMDLGGVVVTEEELAYLQLGKLHWFTRESHKVKRLLTKKLCESLEEKKGSAGTPTPTVPVAAGLRAGD